MGTGLKPLSPDPPTLFVDGEIGSVFRQASEMMKTPWDSIDERLLMMPVSGTPKIGNCSAVVISASDGRR